YSQYGGERLASADALDRSLRRRRAVAGPGRARQATVIIRVVLVALLDDKGRRSEERLFQLPNAHRSYPPLEACGSTSGRPSPAPPADPSREKVSNGST